MKRFVCGALHDYEVFALVALSGEIGAPYPGDDELVDEADQGCLEQFAAYVGLDHADFWLSFWSYYPSAETWHGGDRLVICVIEGDGKLRGSVEGRAY